MQARRDPALSVAIYVLVDPRTDVIRYVGQTASPLALRLSAHVTHARSALTRSSKDSWIVEVLASGAMPVIRALHVVAANAADEAERRAIQEHMARGVPLLNVRRGGTRGGGALVPDNATMRMWDDWAAWMAHELLTPLEVAALTGTTESGWRNKAAAGDIPGALKKGKQWLLPRSGLASIGVSAPDDLGDQGAHEQAEAVG